MPFTVRDKRFRRIFKLLPEIWPCIASAKVLLFKDFRRQWLAEMLFQIDDCLPIVPLLSQCKGKEYNIDCRANSQNDDSASAEQPPQWSLRDSGKYPHMEQIAEQ